MGNLNLKGSTFYTGCIKKVDPFKFKLAIAIVLIRLTLIASNYGCVKTQGLLLMGQNNSKKYV